MGRKWQYDVCVCERDEVSQMMNDWHETQEE